MCGRPKNYPAQPPTASFIILTERRVWIGKGGKGGYATIVPLDRGRKYGNSAVARRLGGRRYTTGPSFST